MSAASFVVRMCQSCTRGGFVASSEDEAMSVSFGTFVQSFATTNSVPFTAMTLSRTVYPSQNAFS